jgi:hypothetical protein
LMAADRDRRAAVVLEEQGRLCDRHRAPRRRKATPCCRGGINGTRLGPVTF